MLGAQWCIARGLRCTAVGPAQSRFTPLDRGVQRSAASGTARLRRGLGAVTMCDSIQRSSAPSPCCH